MSVAVDNISAAGWRIANTLVETIRERTRRGEMRGANPKYSKRWLNNRARRGLQLSPPNLEYEEGMLGALGVIEFGGNVHDATGTGSTRRSETTGRWVAESFSGKEIAIIGFPPGEERMKAKVHNAGMQTGNAYVPQREFMFVREDELREAIGANYRPSSEAMPAHQIDIYTKL